MATLTRSNLLHRLSREHKNLYATIRDVTVADFTTTVVMDQLVPLVRCCDIYIHIYILEVGID